jgi:amino acid transporter
VLTIPLVFALAGNGTWIAYALATVQVTLIALLIGALARRSASPGSLYSYATDSLPPVCASIAAWALPQLQLKGSSISGIRLGLVLAIFSFVGFESATALGHEAKEPLRTIPRAVLQCAVGAGVFFILAAYTEVLGFRGTGLALDKADAPLHVLANQASVPVLGILIDAGAMVSMFACGLACITAGARILLLMAHNGLVPIRFCKTHHRNETPHVGVVLTAVVVLLPPLVLSLLGYSGTDIYGWMGSFAVYGFLTIYGLTCIALPLQLKRQGALSLALLVTAILAGISMVMALAGTLYPVPAAPYSWLPYLYFVYLLVTLVFFFRTRQKRGAPINGMDSLS